MTNLDKRVTDACHRIEELCYETGGKCYVSFSGGKDSTVLLALIKLCEEVYTIPENAIPAVFINTGIELGVTVDFVKWVRDNYYQNVQIIRPAVSFDWVLKNKGKPMLSKLKSEALRQYTAGKRTEAIASRLRNGVTVDGIRDYRRKIPDKYMHILHDGIGIRISNECCKYMKKKPALVYAKKHGALGQIVGLRAEEGGAREIAARSRITSGGKLCTYTKKGMLYKAPLIDWSEDDIEQFIKQYNVPLSEAYTKYGFQRTGCMGCPFSQNLTSDLQYLYYHEPNRYKASMHWLKDVYIAQNVILPFDESYERERERTWRDLYEPMRQEMLRKYRPHSKLIKDGEQLTLF